MREHRREIKCIDCKYALPDKVCSEKNWTAYECTNKDSDFHRCLLNVTKGGNKQEEITWCGCEHGSKK